MPQYLKKCELGCQPDPGHILQLFKFPVDLESASRLNKGVVIPSINLPVPLSDKEMEKFPVTVSVCSVNDEGFDTSQRQVKRKESEQFTCPEGKRRKQTISIVTPQPTTPPTRCTNSGFNNADAQVTCKVTPSLHTPPHTLTQVAINNANAHEVTLSLLTPPQSLTQVANTSVTPQPLLKKRTTYKSIAREAGLDSKTLTPGKKQLMTMVKNRQKTALLFQRRYKYILKKAKINASLAKQNNNSIKLVGNLDISQGAKMILSGEIRNFQKVLTSRTWSTQQKCWALALYKRGPRAYRWLRRSVTLPAEKTLKNVLSKIKLEPGVSPYLLKVLHKKLVEREQSANQNPSRLVTLAFDEMFINEDVYYDTVTDQIKGLEDFGDRGRTSVIANHVLVFMVQSVTEDLKFPVGYYPVSNTCPSDTLAILIPSVIRDLKNIGLTVLASISDQGPTNRGAITTLRGMCSQGTNDCVYMVDGAIVVHLWDTPHLLKSVRNNLLTSDLVFAPGRIAKWRNIIEFYKKDESICKTSPLTYAHMCPTGKNKMRVKLAVQVASEKVSSGMLTFIELVGDGKFDHWRDTAEFLRDLDTLFDSLNGPGRKDKPKRNRINVSEDSYHHSFWREMRENVSKWIFIRKEKGDKHVPPCVQGLKDNLISYERLWNSMSKMGLTSMKLRKFNQDVLENYFCLIRQSCGDNTDPTLSQFEAGMKTALVQEVTKGESSPNGNCEEDGTDFLLTLADLIEETICSQVPEPDNPVLLRAINRVPLQNPSHSGKLSRVGPSLTCVDLCAKLLSAVERCPMCVENFTTEDCSSDTALQMMREDTSCCDKPSPHLINIFISSQKKIEVMWQELQSKKKIKQAVIEKLNGMDYGWIKCSIHSPQTKKLLIDILASRIIKLQCSNISRGIKERRKRVSRQALRAKSKQVPSDFGIEDIYLEDWRVLTGLTTVNSTAAVILQDNDPLKSSRELLQAAIQSTETEFSQTATVASSDGSIIETNVIAGTDQLALLQQFEAMDSGSSNEEATSSNTAQLQPLDTLQESLAILRLGKTSSLSVKQLRELLKFWGVKGGYALKKAKLIELVSNTFKKWTNNNNITTYPIIFFFQIPAVSNFRMFKYVQ
ncbi:Transposable element P transposase [Frankliniella fusca]|uniref:Transposable element P transposase n=1 Tax=Frankliniella fusca TaxID=407009 RepID=A0AAE1GQP6_9NEOP|nr:Transposable element P transposase [Frankliniella fusca]